ncbi:MAG: helix-turn-helix domain-containing protein [bacterium]
MKNKDHQPENDFFIGARLAARRQKLGIEMEKAARDIRVSVSRLSQIEVDDFSSFSHPTYARLFLVDYANYLRVPLEDVRDYLPGTRQLGSSDNSYLQVLLARQTLLHGDQFKSLRRLLFGVGAGLAFLILVAAGIYFWKTVQKLERVQTPITVPRASSQSTPVLAPKPHPPTAKLPNQDASSQTAEKTPTPLAKPSATPFTLPPFEPSSRPKRP